MRFITIFCLLIFPNIGFSQVDSLTLHVEQVLQIVRQYHPIVKQAQINIEKSTADITTARGAFNPIISNYNSNKNFSGTNYYDYTNPNITIPTWFGIEVSSGLENLNGTRINPTETMGQSSYIGVNIPLIKNSVMDKRRAYLNRAKVYNEMTIMEQNVTNNNILMEAAVQYWEWVNAYEVYQIIEKNLLTSKQRVELIKKTVINGEKPAIDSIEALTQYQSFELLKQEYWLKFQQEGLQLSAFLWLENDLPYQLPQNIVPQKKWDNELRLQELSPNLTELINNAKQNHPELKLYSQKLDILGIEKKLKFQELLPKLDISYYHLNKGYNPIGGDGFISRDNYQFGLKFEMPLFFSQGRGEYKTAKLKIDETYLSQNQKALEIELKIKNYFFEFETLKSQVNLQKAMLQNFEKMLKAEQILFQNGESSLFLINNRENKVLETEKKLVEFKTKLNKTIYMLQWATGLLR